MTCSSYKNTKAFKPTLITGLIQQNDRHVNQMALGAQTHQNAKNRYDYLNSISFLMRSPSKKRITLPLSTPLTILQMQEIKKNHLFSCTPTKSNYASLILTLKNATTGVFICHNMTMMMFLNDGD
jgi:hypothetical protein